MVKGGEGGDWASGVYPAEERLVCVYKVVHNVGGFLRAFLGTGY